MVCVLGVAALYCYWARGSVVLSLTHVSGDFPHTYTFRIREIPVDPPGLNDGYSYRCEIWVRGILMKASTHRWDSFEARTTSISVCPDNSVVFHIDDHDISCSSYTGRSERWEELHRR
jgi:hypothetical protein